VFDVVYWELAKGTNRFFVTFEKGKYAFPNGKRESIATMEIDHPHTTANTGSPAQPVTMSFLQPGASRTSVPYDLFFQDEEKQQVSGNVLGGEDHQNNGFITMTELKGTRFFASTITSSIFTTPTYHYDFNTVDNQGDVTTTSATRQVSSSYFYPFSQYQLSVLRNAPSIIINLDQSQELPQGIGQDGYAIVPENTHPRIKDNLFYYLNKAGIIQLTAPKAPERPERGGQNVTGPTLGSQLDNILDKAGGKGGSCYVLPPSFWSFRSFRSG
jgi:hypothetical protein